MLKSFFKKKQRLSSKEETWKEFELFQLFDDLSEAKELLSKMRDGHAKEFTAVEEFYEAYDWEQYDLKYQNLPDFQYICNWFAPNGTWDQFVGQEGTALRMRIFKRAQRYQQAQMHWF